MRICVMAPAPAIHTQKWVRYFINSGHEVHIVSHMPFQKVVIDEAKLHILSRFPLRLGLFSAMLDMVLGVIQVRKLLKKIRPDIIHAHYITDNGVIAAMSGFHPLVLSPWGSDVLIDPKRYPFIKPFTKYALNKADLIIYNSETLKESTLQLGANENKIRYVAFGVDTEQFSPQKRDRDLKKKLGISEAPTVISIRNFNPVYNLEMFIRAIPLVLKEIPEARFILVGDGKQRKYLQDLASSLGVSETIRFTGEILHDEVPKYLASSDVYVSTSISDSTALSQKEAMACELAPVVTKIQGNQEIITDGDNGFLVPVGDYETLAMKIVYLLKNKEIRDKMGVDNRKLIKRISEYETEMAKAEGIYQELVVE